MSFEPVTLRHPESGNEFVARTPVEINDLTNAGYARADADDGDAVAEQPEHDTHEDSDYYGYNTEADYVDPVDHGDDVYPGAVDAV